MQKLFYFILPWGPSDIIAAGPEGALSRLYFSRGREVAEVAAGWGVGCHLVRNDDFLPSLQEQLRRYLNGEPVAWEVEIQLPGGTPFQQRVWRELRKIPYGCTVTYGQIAAELGMPRAARAAGSAIGANPVSIIIPCHRVIGADGGLHGFGGGLPVKQALLELEGVAC
jgi:methylated-DNA-[protein]-cysteine S-methyltransferase